MQQTHDPFPRVPVVRKWKSDGSRNVMPLGNAALNLERNSVNGYTPEEAAERLLSGASVETKLAVFVLEACEQ